MKPLFRISGIHKEIGKRVYLTYATHQGQTFYSFQKSPTRFKNVTPDKFMELQLIAQSSLNHVTWECSNPQLVKRYQTGATAQL